MPALNVEIIFAVYILTQMSHQTCGLQDASSPSVHLTISTFQRQTLYDLVQKTFEEARMGYEMCIVDWTWWSKSTSTSPSSLASWSPSSSSYSSYSSLFSSSSLVWWPSHPTAFFIHDASVLPPLAFLSASWWWIVMLFLLVVFFTMWYVVSHCSYWVKVGKTIDCPMYVYLSIFFDVGFRYIKYACISILFYHKMLQGAERPAPYCTPLAVVGSVGFVAVGSLFSAASCGSVVARISGRLFVSNCLGRLP